MADTLHQPRGEDGIVLQDRAEVVQTRDVRRLQHRHHTRGAPHRLEIEMQDACMRPCRQTECRMQRAARLGDVVDVGGAARHMQMRTLVYW